MRSLWFDHVHDMLKQIKKRPTCQWRPSDIRTLFDVGRVSAQKILQVLDHDPSYQNLGGRGECLKCCLEEFQVILLPRATDKKQSAIDIETARILFRHKVKTVAASQKEKRIALKAESISNEVHEGPNSKTPAPVTLVNQIPPKRTEDGFWEDTSEEPFDEYSKLIDGKWIKF